SLIAGGFKNNTESLKVLVNEGPKDVLNLIEMGVNFDKKEDGSYDLTLEGGHSRHRIFHHKDNTGYELVEKLLAQAQTFENITLLDQAIVCDLKQAVNGFSLDVLRGEEHLYFNCTDCVLATGGIGRVYEYTTNSAIATGDGITLAYRMGAKIKNLHLVQFHPTAFANKDRECFLISESVRGEGAYLLNANHQRFMSRYDDRLELAPRDVVSHCIIEESHRLHDNHFYLDITHKDADFLKKRFPMIYSKLLEEGIDITKDLIPVYPCQHYLMGGIDVALNGESSIPHLYAAGECSHTGVHGNNRLASNSLLEAIVFARQIAEDINVRTEQNEKLSVIPYAFSLPEGTEPIPHGIRTEIRAIMQKSHFVFPDTMAAIAGFERIQELKNMIEKGNFFVNVDYIEARSLATVAYLILKEVI
ncbi:MAG: FAD-binding protein, partial [Oscillospiraceae bacterium]